MADLVDHDMRDEIFQPDPGLAPFGQQRLSIARSLIEDFLRRSQ
jgi:hypothetical protein